MSAGYFPKRETLSLKDLFKGLATASHVLHYHGVLDAYGHVSVRSPDNPATFWMPRNVPPALISSPNDFVEYKIEDASAVETNAAKGYVERYIHSEIYKKFPDINSVVHSHSEHVLPYAVSGVPLKPTIHMAGFLGTTVPIWNISSAYSSGSLQDVLVRDVPLGASFASTFKPATSTGFIYSKVRSALPSQIGGSQEPDNKPNHSVSLMQNHGFTTVAYGIEEAVYQAIYTQEAAKAQTSSLVLRNAYVGHVLEGKVDVEGGGKFKSAKVKAEGGIAYLTDQEAHDTWKSIQTTIERPWELWQREVEVHPLYRYDSSGTDYD
ncbi:unnamed protein product [Periconia digitata]|uniref:Class II aldolase/adducin N-terminal domain-containing protein n=1 Tax=Periconia digitata TaxID=1303443 RepID=A0A9W4UGW4_9PLEO|nr:unnamed protein product [Periconia digitata]